MQRRSSIQTTTTTTSPPPKAKLQPKGCVPPWRREHELPPKAKLQPKGYVPLWRRGREPPPEEEATPAEDYEPPPVEEATPAEEAFQPEKAKPPERHDTDAKGEASVSGTTRVEAAVRPAARGGVMDNAEAVKDN